MIKTLLIGTIVTVFIFVTGCSETKKTGHEEHSGHSDTEKTSHNGEAKDEHENEKADAHSGHAEEGTEIEIAPEFMKMAGISLSKVNTGTIKTVIDLAGEVGFNEDRLIHITPRFPGIIKETNFKIGEFVNAGSIVATIESNESMTQYALKAPISGRIIEKHASTGEHVSEEESLYMLADLSTVWVNLAVYQKDVGKIKVGQKVIISSVGSENTTEGSIQYVTPIIDPQTRKVTARVALPNNDNSWRPGSFIKAHIEIGEGVAGLVVDKDAVQVLNNKQVVFVQHEPNTFKPVEVIVGESDSHSTRILDGLVDGAEYVNTGAFELKAKIVTSSLGGHAGHGH